MATRHTGVSFTDLAASVVGLVRPAKWLVAISRFFSNNALADGVAREALSFNAKQKESTAGVCGAFPTRQLRTEHTPSH